VKYNCGLQRVRTRVAALSILLAAGTVAAAQSNTEQTMTGMPMQIQSAYQVIVTDKLAESRDFYVRWFGFQPLFEASWFVYLQAGGDQPWGIAFMSSDHPSQPPGPETFGGKGVFLTLQVEDAAAEFGRLKQAGVRIAYPVKDEAWGQRRFGLIDPSGLWVDVVQQIDPAPGFWEQYMKP
jgi:catechol 2,3-dioxygenase-like lactoylglutathione lyase family enzyme